METTRKIFLMLFLVACGTVGALAQSTRAAISGLVTDEKGEPIIGAIVTVKNESTGFKVSAPTSIDGFYNIREIPLGSPYTVSTQYIGYGDQKKTGYSLNQGDVLRVDFKLTDHTVEIKTVEVVANSLKKGIQTEGSGTSVSATDIKRLPVNGRNFTSLMDLSPLSNGGSIGGQLASSTNYTIDGMTAKGTVASGTTSGAYTISMEALREFKVLTNQYDVTQGRSGGGTVSAVTKSGTNTLTGSAFVYGRTDWLSSPYNIRGNKTNSDYSTFQYGFSLGGPIIKDRLHFFVTWDHQVDSRPITIAYLQNPSDENLYNITQATEDRFLDIARSKYGASNNKQFGEFDKSKNTDAVFAKIDWQINPTNLFTLQDNFITEYNKKSEQDNTAINIFEVWPDRMSHNNALMASLRSVLNPKMTNELKAQHFLVHEGTKPNAELPSASIPRAIVENVESTNTTTGKTMTTSIQLGGQRYVPESFTDQVFQVVDNLYYNTGKLNFTFGADLMYTYMHSKYGSEMNGRFYFTGLDNFESLKPYRYAREVRLTDDPYVNMNTLNSAVYGQVQTRLAKGLDVMAGLRIDYTRYFNRATFNQTVYDELGLRTDNVISTFQPSPRVQLTWDVNDRHTDVFRLGGGIFGSDINNYLMINNMLFDGTKVASVDVQGDLVPTPNFPSYRQNPSTAPGKELFDNPNIPKLSTINTNGKDARVPVIYKMNASYTHFFSDRLKLGVSFYANWGRHNYFYADRNMVDEPYFRIAAEANRPVYVPAESINTTNGATDWTKGRKSDKVGRVLELISDGKNNQYAFVVDAAYRYYKDGEISVSYTWNDTKDNVSYNGNVANSSTLYYYVPGDPRDLSKMTYSDNQFRHKLVVYGTLPTFWGINVGLRFSGFGGSRYSLCVNGNVNGDFVSTNDLAYVYDPNDPNTPQYLRDGINAILDNPNVSNSMKKYLRNSFGKVAERNGGVNGFYGVFDLHIGKDFKIYKAQKLSLSVDIFNVANLLNKNWGVGRNLSKTYLYNVKGFDAEKKQFVYSVNTNAGVPACNGNPYQFQIGLRYGF